MVVDSLLEGRVDPPSQFKTVYTPLRGREFRFDWNLKVSVCSREQSIADILSYDPSWEYLLWYYGRPRLR